MNIYLVQLISKVISVLFVSVATFFNMFDMSKEIITVNNSDASKGSEVVNTVVEYDTILKYSSKMPINNQRTLVQGENGLIYQDEEGKLVRTIKEKVDEVIEVGTGKYGEYNGVLTLYGADCDTCDGVGYVYCPVENNKYHNLIEDGIYYEDKEYGKVRILSAALVEFPCGTIIEINNSDMENIIGIVLDTGSGMKRAYSEGWILIDLAHQTETDLPTHGTNRNTNFSVRRWGW